jgi:hypothetical protein
MPDELKQSLEGFVRFAQSLKGDERGEAPPFLEHFFRALGHPGVIEVGATFEFRVAKKPSSARLELVVAGNGASHPKSKGGKKFADLLWPDRVLIEMKKRGENLERHYDPLFDYWSHIVPKRPPYAILCSTERRRDTDRCRVRWTDDARDLRAAQRFTGVAQRRRGTFARVAFPPRPRPQRICDLDRQEVRKIVVSVKGGGIKPDDVRALNDVREPEAAEIALFISLEQATTAMVKDAASVGFYESPNGKKYPRVQLLTVDGLLNGTQRAENPDYEPDPNFKKAKAEQEASSRR